MCSLTWWTSCSDEAKVPNLQVVHIIKEDVGRCQVLVDIPLIMDIDHCLQDLVERGYYHNRKTMNRYTSPPCQSLQTALHIIVSSTYIHTHLLKIVEDFLPGSVIDVLSKPVVEGLFFAVLSLNEEAGRTLKRERNSRSYSDFCCSLVGFIWWP